MISIKGLRIFEPSHNFDVLAIQKGQLAKLEQGRAEMHDVMFVATLIPLGYFFLA